MKLKMSDLKSINVKKILNIIYTDDKTPKREALQSINDHITSVDFINEISSHKIDLLFVGAQTYYNIL